MAIPGYRIVRKIRQGGMSTVYLAIQQSIDREVAIKVMSPSLNGDGNFGSRFYREAKIVGKLSHPNIVSIYDVGNHKHYNYIAMDYLPGKPLQDRLEEGVSVTEATQVIREMASAINYAHNRGFVHRDIKPDNILFRDDGASVLCDFGIAKALKGNIKMTNYGAVLGTPHYMSPEQAQGKGVDGRADIYSLGVVFFEMLSGQVPFSGDDAIAIAVKHMTSAIPKLPVEQRRFQPIIDQMMDKKISSRFQTGEEVIKALDQLEQSQRQHDSNYLTQSRSTTLQVLSLLAVLFDTLTTTISISIKRVLLTNIKFNSDTIQLSKKQQDELDSFILNDDDDLPEHYSDLPLIQDTIEQPAIRYRWNRLLWPLILIIVGLTVYSQLPLLIAPVDVAPTTIPAQVINNNDKPNDAISTQPTITIDKPKTIDITSIAIEPDEEIIDEIKHYTLSIIATPADASIRILNIKPRYQKGMKLTSRAYHIAISAKGYYPQKFWLRINDSNVKRRITLKPTRRLLAAGTIVRDKLITGEQGPKMVILPQQNIGVDNPPQTLETMSTIAISQYEITFSEFDQFATNTNRGLPKDQGWGRQQRPVININFDDANAYASWLSQQTGKSYRLPTQQEWEHASRGGKETFYWWGDKNQKNQANCRKGCNSKFKKFFSSTTAPVGSYTANPYGIYDTAGNVAEWLNACQTQQGSENIHCKSAAVAGGSHQDKIENLSANAITNTVPSTHSKAIGFRLILDL